MDVVEIENLEMEVDQDTKMPEEIRQVRVLISSHTTPALVLDSSCRGGSEAHLNVSSLLLPFLSVRHNSSRPAMRPIGPDPDLLDHIVSFNDWNSWFRATNPQKVSAKALWREWEEGAFDELTSTFLPSFLLCAFVLPQAEEDDDYDRKLNDIAKPKKSMERYEAYKKRFLSRQVRSPHHPAASSHPLPRSRRSLDFERAS